MLVVVLGVGPLDEDELAEGTPLARGADDALLGALALGPPGARGASHAGVVKARVASALAVASLGLGRRMPRG